MRRAPRCEVETVREARRTVRLSAGTVPLTIAERRLLDLLVDTTSGAQELREACGYREIHPLRVLLRRLIRAGHAEEDAGNRFTITEVGAAAHEGPYFELRARRSRWNSVTSHNASTGCCERWLRSLMARP